MKMLYSFFDFYVKSSIHLSISVLALTVITYLRLKIEFSPLILFIIFNSTIITYNFIKFASTLPYYFFVNNVSIKKIQYLSFFSGILLFISLFFATMSTILLGLFISFFCFIYVIPFNRTKTNIRNYSRIKIYIVAFCWSAVSVLFPLLSEIEIDFITSFLLFIQRFLFVIVCTIPFEIRDLKFDSLKLKTMPQVFGIKKTKSIAFVLLLVFLFLSFVINPQEINYIISDLLIAIIIGCFVVVCKKNQTKYFSSFWVESVPIFWLLIVMLINYFLESFITLSFISDL